MFLEKDTITVSKESIKKYGASGAVILQVLYSEYEDNNIPLKVNEWCSEDGILEFIQSEIVKRTLTGLDSKGLIKIQDNTIILLEKRERKEKKVKAEKKEREPQEHWEMAKVLMEVYGEDVNLFSPKRHIKFAQKLLGMNVTIEDIKRLYIGEDSWWYISTFSGQHGNKPNQITLGKTINDALNGKSINSQDKASTGGFWS